MFVNGTSHDIESWYRQLNGTSEDFQLFRDQLEQIRNKPKGKNKHTLVHVLGDFNLKDIDSMNQVQRCVSQREIS